MKKIGTGTGGGVLIEIGPADLIELKHIVRNRVIQFADLIMEGLIEAVGLDAKPVTEPGANVQSAATKPAEREIKPAKREIAAKAAKATALGVRVCEGCGKEYQAVRKDQRNCSKKCNHKRSRTEVAQEQKPGTRVAKCDTCHKPFTARVFGPVPHHCPTCRPGGKKTAAAPPPALPKPQAQRRPPIPADPTGKVDRIRLIREANERLDAIPAGVAAAIADAQAADDLG